MATVINLNTIMIMSLVVLFIIILSGIKICKVPSNSNQNSKFIDTKYKYVSEPFGDQDQATTLDYSKEIGSLANQKFKMTATQITEQLKQNNQINFLTKQIEALENKINVLQQMWA